MNEKQENELRNRQGRRLIRLRLPLLALLVLNGYLLIESPLQQLTADEQAIVANYPTQPRRVASDKKPDKPSSPRPAKPAKPAEKEQLEKRTTDHGDSEREAERALEQSQPAEPPRQAQPDSNPENRSGLASGLNLLQEQGLELAEAVQEKLMEEGPVPPHAPASLVPPRIEPGAPLGSAEKPTPSPKEPQDAPPAVVEPTPTPEPKTLIVENAGDAGATVHFMIDGQVVSLAPGEKKRWEGDEPHKIVFDRGGDFGAARRAIVEGTWRFHVTSRGWRLVEQSAGGASSGKE